jgi:hypothetical protein
MPTDARSPAMSRMGIKFQGKPCAQVGIKAQLPSDCQILNLLAISLYPVAQRYQARNEHKDAPAS